MRVPLVCLLVAMNAVVLVTGSDDDPTQQPLICVCIAARNAQPILPYFLGYLEELDYDKQLLALFITSDHNQDGTGPMLTTWTQHVRPLYHSVQLQVQDTPDQYDNTLGPFHWVPHRYNTVMSIKEQCLQHARSIGAEYLLLLDTDALLTHALTLRILLSWQQPIVAPMLTTVHPSNYSNFWAGITSEGYYRRTDKYLPILQYTEQGCHHVAMVHSCVLIHLGDTRSHSLSFLPASDYTGPVDDLLVFGESTDHVHMDMFVVNTARFGYVLDPLPDWNGMLDLQETVRDVLQLLTKDGSTMPLLHSPLLPPIHPPKHTLGLQHIYMVNLHRRSARRHRMQYLFQLFGMDVQIWPAVDGLQLNGTVLKEWGVQMLPGYKDPYYDRPLKMGEIGCFLSHHQIWLDMIKEQYGQVLIVEDDLRFNKYFTYMLQMVLSELHKSDTDWDLIYLGRKWMGWMYGQQQHQVEHLVKGNQYLSTVGYSYWTVGYLLSASGAAKLVAAQPLKQMIALDEFLPVMYSAQPNQLWTRPFQSATKLKAFTTVPELLQPSHYTHEQGYVTDTEQTHVVDITDDDNDSGQDGVQTLSRPMSHELHTEL